MIGPRTSRRRSVSDLLPNRFFFSVAGGPGAPSEARNRVAGRLSGLLDGDSLDSLRLIMSELTTNCVQHAQANDLHRIEVAVSLPPGLVRVSVSTAAPPFDNAPGKPVRCGPPEARGRGLYIVDRLARRWGVEHGARNEVWFELATERAA